MKNEIKVGYKEFVALMAALIALTAMSIDAMLPALTVMGQDLGVTEANDNQLIISTLFFGLALGQILYGPFSDSYGRKPAVYLGFTFFIIGCFVSLYASNLTVMLVGRVLQGIGVAGPRILSMAIIRDLYKGDEMAQVMSFVMAAFIIVPSFAPAMGQGIMLLTNWHAIFIFLIGLCVIIFIWFGIRQDETLAVENRIKFSVRSLWEAVKEVFHIRSTVLYTIASGSITGAFIGMLNSSAQIFQIQFGLGERFPLYFAAIAISIGIASFVNGRLVMKFGMYNMVKTSSLAIVAVSIVFVLLMNSVISVPSLGIFMIYLLSTTFFIGILFGNLNAMAMEPLGHMAGLGSAVVGSLSTFISIPMGTYIGMRYDGTVSPLVIGFLVFGLITLLCILIEGSLRKR